MSTTNVPSVVFRPLPSGTPMLLLPGDIIGRSGVASLQLEHPGISEVHAYISLRGGTLVLIALRGRIGVHERVLSKIELEPGQRIRLTRDLELEVVDVTLPDRVLALQGDGFPKRVLTGACSLVFDPEPSLAPGNVSDAPLQFWNHDADWMVREPGGEIRPIHANAAWQVEGRTFSAAWVSMERAGTAPTRNAEALNAPLVIRAKYDSVHIERDGHLVVSLAGRQAQLISELIAFDGPTDWQLVAAEIWVGTPQATLRSKLDATLFRLRKRLAAASVRRNLICTDGCGKLELVTVPGDRIEADL